MRRTSSAGSQTNSAGFTYVMVLVAIVVTTIMTQVAARSSFYLVRADREQELLFRGQAYVNAIASYYHANRQQLAYPRFLSDLETDPRFLNRSHIRQLYPEPFADEWQLIRNGEGGIMGVASRSTDQPMKRANFPLHLQEFTDADQYHQWQFIYLPPRDEDV